VAPGKRHLARHVTFGASQRTPGRVEWKFGAFHQTLTPAPNCKYFAGVRRLAPFVFIISALALTWPLALKLTTHVPLGSEPAEAVPLLNVWTIGWNGMSLGRGFDGYWDAPIFYPSRGTFSFSDPQPLTALPGALLWNRSPALAYNAVLLGYLTLNGFVTFRILQQRGVPFGPALVGGLFVEALPFATNERGVLQLQPLFGPVWAIGALWNLFERPSTLRSLSLGLALAVTFLTSEYFALLLVPALVVGGTLHLAQFRRPKTLRHLGLTAALAFALALPVALPQAEQLDAMGFQRSESSFARTSAWPADYVNPSLRLRIAEVIPETNFHTNQRLFPGSLLTAVAIVALVFSMRSNRSRRWTLFLLITGGLGFALSLGSHLTIAGFSPFSAIHQAIPVLAYTRSPFRFAVLLQLAIALLAVEGVARLWARRQILAIFVAVLALLEIAPLPERLEAVPSDQPLWVNAVMGLKQPVVVHLPWAPERSASSFAQTTRWMIEALPHDMKLVNGYSGFFPTLNSQLRDLLEDFPNSHAIGALNALGVDFIVLHENLDSARQERIIEVGVAGQISELQIAGSTAVMRLPGGPIRSISAYSGQWRLRSRSRAGRTQIEGLPGSRLDSFLVYSAGTTQLDWSISSVATDPDGIRLVPKGTVLFFPGSDAWLQLGIDLAESQTIELLDGSAGEVIGSLMPEE
jgi:hypothetical protein